MRLLAWIMKCIKLHLKKIILVLNNAQKKGRRRNVSPLPLLHWNERIEITILFIMK